MILLAALVWLLFAFLPGFALLRLAGVGWSVPARLAAAPTVGLGALYVVALAGSRLGAPVIPITVGAAVAIVAAAGIHAAFHGRDERGQRWAGLRSRLLDRAPAEQAGRVLLLIGVMLSAAIWVVVLRGLEFPPGWDSMHHGYFTRQILEFGTLDSATVLASAPTAADGGSSFYPLIFNLVSAATTALTGVHVSQTLFAGTAVVASVASPLGAYALARVLGPSRPLVAGVSAVIVALPATTYLVLESGRMNAVLGLTVTLGTVVAILAAGAGPRWRHLWVPALAVVGLIGLHTSEIPVAVLVAGAIALVWLARSRDLPAFLRWLGWGAGATLVGVIVVILLEPAIVGATQQRSGALERPEGMEVMASLTAIAGLGSYPGGRYVLPVLVLAGVLISIAIRRWRPYAGLAIAYALFFLLAVGLLTQSLGPLVVIAAPWYQDVNRLAWTHVILGAIPAAVALVAGLTALGGLLARARRGPRNRLVRPVAISVAALAILALTSAPSVSTMRQALAQAAPASADSRIVFETLSHELPREAVVLDDLRASGSLWMYDDYAVRPLFGNSPYLGAAPSSWKERLWLIEHLADIDTDPCVAAMIQRHGVTHVYYDPAMIWDATPNLSLDILEGSTAFSPFTASGSVRVFEVDLGDRPTSCDRDVTQGVTW